MGERGGIIKREDIFRTINLEQAKLPDFSCSKKNTPKLNLISLQNTLKQFKTKLPNKPKAVFERK